MFYSIPLSFGADAKFLSHGMHPFALRILFEGVR
jgi:hypothetical protein